MKTTIKTLLACSSIIGCGQEKKECSPKPNIIMILADDLGQSQVGCYGTQYYSTPNIDKLARNGMKFTNAYSAAAVSSPTRGAILTGKYPGRTRLTDFVPGNKSINKYKEPDWQKYLPLKETTIAEIIQENNYATAWIGKWHLSKKKTPPESLTHNPTKQGFDEDFITYKPAKSKHLGFWQNPEMDAHNVDTITNRSLEFIEKNKDKPFFLVVAHNTIHDPLMDKKELVDKYKKKKGATKAENNPIIGAMLERLDKNVEKVYQRLKTLNLLENTLIIFYSDNGGKEGHAKQTPYRAGKGWLYEGGIKVPLIISWEGKIKKNTVNKELVSSIDFFPTVLNLCQICHTSNKVDGIDISSTILRNEELKRKTLYWHYPHYHKGSGMKPASALRSGKYKLIQWHENLIEKKENAYELYNLDKDISESKNLVNKEKKIFQELKTKLNKWKKETKVQNISNFSN
jgi:uncharacterized sulfatase